MSNTDDLFDGVDDMSDALQQGRLEGMQAGKDAGFHDGRKLGQVNGVDYGMEIGFAMGMLVAVQEWIQCQQKQHMTSSSSENDESLCAQPPGSRPSDLAINRIQTTCQRLDDAIQDFPSIQNLFRSDGFEDNNSIINDRKEASSQSMPSKGHEEDVRQQLQRIRALTKVLATKLGVPRHSLQHVLEQQVPHSRVDGSEPSSKIKDTIIDQQSLTDPSQTTNEW
ncbi:hypothetical protein IV203_032670 [Nitzschia inconspicua]|uniref:Essential protein Yae1 N-terminal domain-containing protein n=1 Tax=Nitzschia inconspicua TaxID=303405 RepID=A0A9K3KK13_9STRA|nr:hypothetical protein IV203_032670 [Nitzschia inconspicua]